MATRKATPAEPKPITKIVDDLGNVAYDVIVGGRRYRLFRDTTQFGDARWYASGEVHGPEARAQMHSAWADSVHAGYLGQTRAEAIAAIERLQGSANPPLWVRDAQQIAPSPARPERAASVAAPASVGVPAPAKLAAEAGAAPTRAQRGESKATPAASRVTADDVKVEVKGDPREIIRLARHQALSLADRVGAREVERIMREAATELDARLRSSITTGSATPTSQREMAKTLAQLNDVVRTVSKQLGASAVSIAADAANSAAGSTFDYLQSMASRTGPGRALPIREASMFSRAVSGAESSILNRLATAEQPSVQWSRSPRSKASGEVLVSVDAARLNELWQRDDAGFIGPGDVGIGKRREGVAAHLRKTPELHASQVHYDPEEGKLVVVDGRHRLAVLRDSGARRVAVAVAPENLDAFLRASGGYTAGDEIALPVPVSLAGDDFTPSPGGVLTRYSAAVIEEFEGVLRRGMLTGKPWGDVRDELTSKSPFLQGSPKFWAERIVRTETMGAYNRAGWEAIRAADDELGDMVKILSATFDDRTGWDSYQVHGQIRRVDEAFAWKGGLYQSPPNRPNDREVVVPHRVSWPIPEELAWRSDGEVAAAWKRDRRKGGPPPRPLMTTIPLARFGREEGRKAGEKKSGGPEGATVAPEGT